MRFDKTELRDRDACPWCEKATPTRFVYAQENGGSVVECKYCKLIYATRILNEKGLDTYWNTYESEVHQANAELTEKRNKMYELEYEYIKCFLEGSDNRILDVGCGGGEFLDRFARDGNCCEGVEFGEEAAKKASQKYKIYRGEFPQLPLEPVYDLIIFRGTIQYFIEPKKYLEKAVQLLKKKGLIFITSSPNSESVCFQLFLNMYNQKVSETDYCMFHEKMLTDFFTQKNLYLVGKNYFYRETPYADLEEDISKIDRAIKLRKENRKIDFKSPAFFDNMLSLVYRKK